MIANTTAATVGIGQSILDPFGKILQHIGQEFQLVASDAEKTGHSAP